MLERYVHQKQVSQGMQPVVWRRRQGRSLERDWALCGWVGSTVSPLSPLSEGLVLRLLSE